MQEFHGLAHQGRGQDTAAVFSHRKIRLGNPQLFCYMLLSPPFAQPRFSSPCPFMESSFSMPGANMTNLVISVKQCFLTFDTHEKQLPRTTTTQPPPQTIQSPVFNLSLDK